MAGASSSGGAQGQQAGPIGPWVLNLRLERPVEGCLITPHAYLYQKGEKGTQGQREREKFIYAYRWLRGPERPVCAKPSKNILKRWNLGNGMLYFFYAAVGRSAPPTGDEILEPFYYQKRVDFVKRACGPAPTTNPATAIKPEPEPEPAKPAGGSTAFFAEQLSLHGARGRKRKASDWRR